MKNSIQVFIVEDDFMVAKTIKEFTEKIDGYEVIGEARDGVEALRRLDHIQPDLLTLDIYMPKMNGVELLRNIRKKKWAAEAIMISASKEMPIIQECLRLGAVDYLLKPFNFDRYKQALFFCKNRLLGYEQIECTQRSLDQLWRGQPPRPSASNLPKGLQEMTLNRVVEHLKQQTQPQSSDEISILTNLSKPTIQRYLRYLDEIKKVKKELIYGSQGRPEHKYLLLLK